MSIERGQNVWNKQAFPNYEALHMHMAVSEPNSFDQIEVGRHRSAR